MEPATISLLASLFGNALPLIGGLTAESPEEQFEKAYEWLKKKTAAERQTMIQQALERGQIVSQNFQATLGETGVGSTGVGATARGLAHTLPGESASRVATEFDTYLRNAAMGAAPGLFGGGRWEKFLSGLGGSIAMGQNPVEDIIAGGLNLIFPQGAGATGGEGGAKAGAEVPGGDRFAATTRKSRNFKQGQAERRFESAARASLYGAVSPAAA